MKNRATEKAAIKRLKEDRKKLTPTDDNKLLKRLEEIRAATESKSRTIANLEKKELTLIALKEDAKQFRESGSKIQLNHLKTQYIETQLTDDQWGKFSLKYKGDVNELLENQIASVKNHIDKIKGPEVGEAIEQAINDQNLGEPYFQKEAVLKGQTYTLLSKELRRLEVCIGLDRTKRNNYNNISNRILREESSLVLRDKEIESAESAPKKINDLISHRETIYSHLIEEIEKETKLLSNLYKPLQDRLDEEKGTLNKLTFSVNRIVDIDIWSEGGERLIDKSRAGTFKGVGTLAQIIKTELEEIWKKGTPSEISDAMSKFRAKYRADFWSHAFEDAKRTRETKRDWYSQVSAWLYSTDHVQVSYGLEYEGVDIQQLSPGTRGIVLLLLYLTIDTNDQRPLVIDQPEENLDPKSIFEELVEQFKEAKTRRQIIIVTHNANLVVNTDADQVIVASRGEHKPNALPDIEYISGGLENPIIRDAVCGILEGGKEAFEERAKRLRISINS